MKLFSRPLILLSVFFFFLCTMPQVASSQPGNPDPDDPGGDPDLPIDGGVSLLIAAGVAYGVKVFRDERHKKLKNLQ